MDTRICSRARLARDARFDGKFFIAVLSTRIYCRPICRARTAKERNVRYYPSAAAAAAAGFRPCLRCRPESSPGTPGWMGTPSTVSRALRLIGESGLEDGGVETLAERLGIGARHLRRLFVRHLGAPPSAVAETRRLHFAKKLIDETRLPMNQVALAAGFGCVRRFNAAIRATYHRTPTQIRRLAPRSKDARENRYAFRLGFRPPYDWDAMLRFLSAHAIPGVESVSSDVYRRSIALNGSEGWFEVSRESGGDALAVRIHFGDPQLLFAIVDRIRAMFDLDADPAEIARWLGEDPLLASAPGARVPGCWDGFELAVTTLLVPRAGVKLPEGLAGLIAERFGRPVSMADGRLTRLFPGADVLARADLRRLGIPAERADAIAALAQSVAGGRISFGAGASEDSMVASLRSHPGFDRSDVEWIAMRALREPDAFPPADAALLRGARLQSSAQLARRAESWRPWRAYAAMCLWNRDASARVGPWNGAALGARLRQAAT